MQSEYVDHTPACAGHFTYTGTRFCGNQSINHGLTSMTARRA